MIPIFMTFLRSYAPYITFPIAAIVGVIGYNLESLMSDKSTPTVVSIKKQREDRLLAEAQNVGALKEKNFVPKTVFERNLSPSLMDGK